MPKTTSNSKKAQTKNKKPKARRVSAKSRAAPKKTLPKNPKASLRKASPKKQKTDRTKGSGLPERLLDAALKVLDERKTENVVTIDMRGRSPLTDYMIVATGRSSRQLAAVAGYLRESFAQNGCARVRIEGLSQGDWVLVDAGDVVVHLFRPDVRRYYGVEDVWSASRRGLR